jgi:hypothetical protein
MKVWVILMNLTFAKTNFSFLETILDLTSKVGANRSGVEVVQKL